MYKFKPNQLTDVILFHSITEQIRNMHHKKIFVFSTLFIFAFLLGACGIGRNARETAAQEWLSTAKRPVKVTKHNPNNHLTGTRGSHFYTLIDSEGKVFLAKNVRFELPEVIE